MVDYTTVRVPGTTFTDGYIIAYNSSDGYFKAVRNLTTGLGAIRRTPTDNNTAICWTFDESTVPYINSGNAGTLSLTTGLGTPKDMTGLFGHAVGLNSCAIYTGNTSIGEVAYPITISVWVYARSFPSPTAPIIIKEYRNNNSWSSPYTSIGIGTVYGTTDGSWQAGFTIAGVAVSSGNISNDLYKIPLNQWTYLACTYDGTIIKAYINGILASSNAASGTIDYGTHGPWDIGGVIATGVGQYWNGAIDDIRIENVIRSQAYLETLYKNGLGQFDLFQLDATSIQGNAVQSGTNGAAQDGYMLTWVNSANQYQAKPAAAVSSGGMETILEIDFTAQSSQNLLTGGDARKTIGGLSIDFAATSTCSAIDVVPGTGVVYTISTAATTTVCCAMLFDNITNSALTQFSAGEEWEYTVVMSQSPELSVTSEALTPLVVRDNTTTRLAILRAYPGAITYYARYVSPGAGVTDSLSTTNTSDTVYQVRCTDTLVQLYTGVYSGTWNKTLRLRGSGTNATQTAQWIASGNTHSLRMYYLTGTSSCAGRVITVKYVRIRRKSV